MTTPMAARAEATACPAPGTRWRIARLAASLAWIAIVAIWTSRFWMMLSDSKSVLVMFEREAGGTLTPDDWYGHVEAREIFCAHPNGDPSTNRIGRYIDATWGYGPLLFLGALPTYASALSLLIANTGRRDRLSKLAAWAVVVIAIVPVVLIIHYSDVISALTNITE